MALRRSRRDDDAPETDAPQGKSGKADSRKVDDDATEPREPLGPRIKAAFGALREDLVPAVAALVLGLVVVGMFLVAFHDDTPSRVPVSVVGSEGVAQAFQRAVDKSSPGEFKVIGVSDPATGRAGVYDRSSYALLVQSATSWQLQYAGANGSTVSNLIVSRFTPSSKAVSYNAVDIVPPAKGDTNGFAVFFLVIGVSLAGFLFAVVTRLRGVRRGPRSTFGGLAIYSVVLALLSQLVASSLHTVQGGWLALFVIQFLLCFAVGAVTIALGRLAGWVGVAVSFALLVVVSGAASGTLLPPPYLASALRWMVYVLPNGLGAQAIVGHSYFQGAGFGLGLYALAGWCILGMVLVAIADRVRPAADDEVPAAAPARR